MGATTWPAASALFIAITSASRARPPEPTSSERADMSTMKPTTLWTEVDFNRDGKQTDWSYLHHSVTRSAYGEIMIPITVVKNGAGPTVLLMAGNHGDEYEGQIA